MKLWLTIGLTTLSLCGFSQTDFVSISGSVMSASGENSPVTNAEIHIRINDSLRFNVPTDANGKYFFKIKRFNGTASVSCQVTTKTRTKKNGQASPDVLPAKDVRTISVSTSKKTDYVENFKLQQGCILYRASEITFKVGSETEKDDLTAQNAADSLSHLADMMKNNPSVVVEICGNADSSEKDKKEASQQRADLVAEALIAKGIQKERIKTKAMSDTQPLVPEAVIKKAKTKEEKEMLRLKNTRVSWKVLHSDFGSK